MEENVGDTESLARIAIGAVVGIVSIVLLVQSKGMVSEIVPLPVVASPVLGVAALALVGTGLTSKCGMYSALGIDTSE